MDIKQQVLMNSNI